MISLIYFPHLLKDRVWQKLTVDQYTSRAPQQSIDQPPYPNSDKPKIGNGSKSEAQGQSVATAYEDSLGEWVAAVATARILPEYKEQSSGTPDKVVKPKYDLRMTKDQWSSGKLRNVRAEETDFGADSRGRKQVIAASITNANTCCIS